VFIDEVDGEATGIVGIAFSERLGDSQLWGLWVTPKSRRSGAAQRLVEHAIEWSREHGAETVTLWVVRSNAAAIALYERNGFSADGEVATLPTNPCIDELAMQRQLSVEPS
jgi:ribosomal-protein-alanine N-acetyltransferase